LALVGQGFFGGGSRKGITQYAGDAAVFDRIFSPRSIVFLSGGSIG